jgi:hypothetical protein
MSRVAENLDYIPLNSQTIKSGMSLDPIEFKIKPESHQRHLDYLKRENGGELFRFSSDFLFPFEMFSLPRVLTNRYKKLNEVLSVRCERLVHRLPQPNELLHADAYVNAVFEKHGLCFGYFSSRTLDQNNELLMTSIDMVLLINGSNINSVRKTITKESPISVSALSDTEFVGSYTLRFRHHWDEGLWINNIHTDKYAQYVGFERGLIEATAFLDVFLSNPRSGFLLKDGVKISWRYQKPLYKGLKVSARIMKGETDTNLLIYENDSLQSVMKIKVEQL